MKPEQRQLRQRRSVLVSLLLTEHISHLFLVILLLTWNRYIAILMILPLEQVHCNIDDPASGTGTLQY